MGSRAWSTGGTCPGSTPWWATSSPWTSPSGTGRPCRSPGCRRSTRQTAGWSSASAISRPRRRGRSRCGTPGRSRRTSGSFATSTSSPSGAASTCWARRASRWVTCSPGRPRARRPRAPPAGSSGRGASPSEWPSPSGGGAASCGHGAGCWTTRPAMPGSAPTSPATRSGASTGRRPPGSTARSASASTPPARARSSWPSTSRSRAGRGGPAARTMWSRASASPPPPCSGSSAARGRRSVSPPPRTAAGAGRWRTWRRRDPSRSWAGVSTSSPGWARSRRPRSSGC